GYLSKNEKGFLRLTEKGSLALERLKLEESLKQKPRRWDKRWRILIFDIPEHQKSLRDKVRRTLAALGFFRLQDSVWIFPYDCEDLVALLKADFKIGRDLTYLIAESVEYDHHLKKEFEL